MRLPEQQRLSIDPQRARHRPRRPRARSCSQAIHRANPALQETDKVLEHPRPTRTSVLADLARDSDQRPRPARARPRAASPASSARRARSRRRPPSAAPRSRSNIQQLPRLPARSCAPTMVRLGVAVGPDDARAAATSARSRRTSTASCAQLGPFSTAADPALERARRRDGRRPPALVKARPIVQDLGRFASAARAAVGATCSRCLTSLRDTGGDRARARLHLLPGRRDQRLRLGRATTCAPA